ncbi:MAG: tsaR [Hyphomicrobiales bacterium]|nr:tsaR [Hyphomicrobiales bacterium]
MAFNKWATGRRQVKLRQLRTIMAVAHYGSMSAAAQAISLSQPAITRVVTLLEKELGIRLFRRTHTGTETTVEGSLLVRAGTAAFRQLCEIEDCSADPGGGAPLCLASSFARQVSDHEIAALIAVGLEGSPRRAAETLGVTQTAVARSLATLAARLGRSPFEDLQSKKLNAWVAEAATKARRALGEIAAAEEFLRHGNSVQQAPVRLRIGALPASRVHLVPEAARRFALSYSALEVSIVDAGYDALLSKLYAGEIDLIVGSIRPNNIPPWVAVETLFADHLVVVAHPDHPLQNLPEVDWWDLRFARWVLPGKPTPIRTEFDRLVTSNAIPAPAQIVEVDSFIAARSFILAGDWIGIFSASQILPEERANLLRRLPMSDLGYARDVGAMTRREECPAPALARFLEELRAVSLEVSDAMSVPRT